MNREEQWLLKEKYNGIETEQFLKDCERLHAGEPLAYLIGSIPFRTVTIHLGGAGIGSERPLIPRTETEYWVGEIIQKIKEASARDSALAHYRVLDLCAGSGCIGVSVLAEIQESEVDFVEIDERHHPLIAENLKANALEASRAHIYGGDLFEHINSTYDFILSNPPYIDKVLGRTEQSVQDHEPALALYGGVDGMEIITKIISESPQHLTPHGMLVLEHEPEQTSAIQALGERHGLHATVYPDQYGVERYTMLTRQAP